MDTTPEHLGFSSYVLFHVGSSLVGTQVIAGPGRGRDDLRPGDGWVVNDPHTGGAMHQGDVSIIMPTFYGDEHLGWSFANMHVLDVGGVGISGYAPGRPRRLAGGHALPADPDHRERRDRPRVGALHRRQRPRPGRRC